MSTKIYVAYKLRRADYLWPLVRDIRLKATENVKHELRRLYKEYAADVKTDTTLYKARLERLGGDDFRTRWSMARDVIHRAYRKNSVSPMRSPFNFDVHVGFRQYKGGLYVIPYCDWTMRRVLDFLKDDYRLRDYHYQNATDKPKTITERDWKERRRVWHGMDATGEWEDVLVLEICSYSMFWKVDPRFDMISEGP